MSHGLQVLLYALVAGFSALALLSTLAVLGSGRLKGTAFGAGFVLGQALMLLVAVLVGSAVTPDRDKGHGTFVALLELALGVALLLLAWRGRRSVGRSRPAEGSKTEAFLHRLRRLGVAAAFGVGALLGVGGPKRLTLTLAAGATIAVTGVARSEELAFGLLYVLVAAALVWIPVCAYLLAGSRADVWATNAQTRLVANERRVTVISAVVFAGLLICDALVSLVT